MEKSFGIVKQALVCVMILGLPSVYCWIDNVPRIDVTCESDLMKVRFKFQRPFKGMVYAIDYSWNPACSFQVPLSTDVMQITLKIPYVTCGTHIDYVPNGHSIISNTIRVQQQRIVGIANDTTNPVSCSILGLNDSFSKFNSNTDETDELNTAPSLEVNIGQDFLGSNLAKELHLFNEPILVFRARNTGKYRDMDVKSCTIHENKVLGANSLVYQVTHPNECDDPPTQIISAFTLFNETNPDELVAFAHLRLLGQLSLVQNIHITCGAQLCKKMCKRKCTKKASNDRFTAVATHQISKRSLLGEAIEQSTTKQQSDVRDKLLKATVNILNNRFFQGLRENSQNSSLKKRSEDEKGFDQSPLMTFEDFYREVKPKGNLLKFRGQTDQGPMTFETFVKTPEEQQRESRVLSETVKESETSPSASTKVQSQNFHKLSKDSQKGAKKKLSAKNRTIMKDLARKLASRSQKLKEHNEKFRDLIKTAKEENFPMNGFILKTPDKSETIFPIDEATDTEIDHDASESVSHKKVKNKRSKLDNFEVTTSIQGVSELDRDKMFTTEDVLNEVTEPLIELLSTNMQLDELKQSTDAVPIISVIEDLTLQPSLVQTLSQEIFPSSSMEPHLIQDNFTETIQQDLFPISSTKPQLTQDDFTETIQQELFPVSSIEPPHTKEDFSETIPRELFPVSTLKPRDAKDDFSETIPQELFPVSSMDPRLTQDNIPECVSKSPEIVSTENTNNEQNLLKLQNSSDISRGTFIVVSILMGFVIFILVVTVIGLILHIRKEKKRHAIDNFLLYNFY